LKSLGKDTSSQKKRKSDEAFETEFGDELSYLIETTCVMTDEKQSIFMPYIN
jgi:hypothetical protein